MKATLHEPQSETILSLPNGIKGITINPAKLRDHVIRPPHLEGVTSDRGLDDEPSTIHRRSSPRGAPKHLAVKAFGDALHEQLKNDVVGYVMRLRQNGSNIWTALWNWAETPSDASLAWTTEMPMHVASVSKLVTAIAMIKLLDDHHLSHNDKIIDHLPAYWTKGLNVDKITFSHLLTHKSGFATGNGESDFETMRYHVAVGVSDDPSAGAHIGGYRYENMNFGLCRILIAILNGNIDKNLVAADLVWDLLTIASYAQFATTHVFSPSGVTGASLDHPSNSALAYKFPSSSSGWNSGNLETVSGGAGWHLTVDQLLSVMGAFRRKGTIMSNANAQKLLDNSFGIDLILPTPAGTLYNKNGRFTNNDRTEQALAYFLPENMELAVFVNSPVGSPSKFFRDVVTKVYLDNLK
jgi:hypothetical protein